jgi:hypothetical protein
MQASELGDDVLSRSEVQVVRVAEDHARAERAHLIRVEALDGPLRADGHEGRRRDVAVRGADHSRAGGAVGGLEREMFAQSVTLLGHPEPTTHREPIHEIRTRV